jgi:transcriptional regulator with XRE-family HTH domain
MKLSNLERLQQLLVNSTQKAAAVKLGVNERTIRKWMHGDRTPTLASSKKIQQRGIIARREIVKEYRRAKVLIPAVPVLLPIRRLKRIDPRDPLRKKKIQSDTTRFKIDKSRLLATAKIIQALRGQKRSMHVLYSVRAGRSDYAGRVSNKTEHVSTGWEYMDAKKYEGLDGILDFLTEAKRYGRLLYLNITDPPITPARKKASKK